MTRAAGAGHESDRGVRADPGDRPRPPSVPSHPSTVVGILDRLEQQIQVARTRSEKDHRVVTVSLTAKGRETVSKVPRIAQGLLLKGLKELSDNDLQTTAEGLRMLVGILGVEGMPPPLLLSPEVNVPEETIDVP